MPISSTMRYFLSYIAYLLNAVWEIVLEKRREGVICHLTTVITTTDLVGMDNWEHLIQVIITDIMEDIQQDTADMVSAVHPLDTADTVSVD